jgi:RHS repeat-associated protein
LTRSAAIFLTLWISLLAGISAAATVHHGQEGVDPASYPLAAYGYDANGNLAGVSYANQVTHAYAYNTLNRLTSLAVDRQPGGSGAIATPLHGYGYTLNLAGQRTHIAELGGRTIAHTYDALHRLTSETIGHAQGNAAGIPLGTVSYAYDETGNRLSRTTAPQNWVGSSNLGTLLPSQNQFYNERDQLAGDSYDANGNTTSSLQSSVFGSSVSDVYSFDNRLIRRVRGDGVIVDLLYSADGDRVAKWTEQGGLMRSIHRYLVDRLNPTGYAQVLEEKDGNGQLVARHLYGHDLIASDKRGLGGSPGDLVRSFYLYDGLGSVRGLTDNTGVLQETYDYDAYGTLIGFAKRNAAGTLEIQNPNNLELITNNRYLFTGEQWDADLGMYFLRARYLNPGPGRFHTEDTYEGRNGEPLTLHKYLYAHANPVMNLDPSGNASLVASFAIAPTLAGSLGARSMDYARVRAHLLALAKPLVIGLGTSAIAGTAILAMLKSDARALERARAEVRDDIKRKSGGNQVLYHYTDKISALAIFASKTIFATPLRRVFGMTFPAGAYATNLPPFGDSHSQSDLQDLFMGGDRSKDFSWFVAIDQNDFIPAPQGAFQFWRPAPFGGFPVPVIPYLAAPSLLDP